MASRAKAMRLLPYLLVLLLSLVLAHAQENAPDGGDSVKLEPVKTKKAVYPLEAKQNGIQGQVWLKVLVSEKGDVENVEVVSGDPVLAKAAADACKKWQFKPFVKGGKAVKVSTKIPFDFYFSGKEMDKDVSADGSAVMDQPLRTKAATAPASSAPAAPAPVSAAPAANAPKRVRASAGVVEGLLVHKIAPVYPVSARQNRVQGTVVLQAVIGKDGRIQNLHPLSGSDELIPAAMGAVQQWRYKPYLLMGEPVEVETVITVNFRLNP